MFPLSGDLDPTPTYARRSWLWLPTADPLGMEEGVLTITLAKGRRPGSKLEVDSYAVQESTLLFHPGRAFLLLNLDDPDQPDVYECWFDGREGRCTCTAGRVGRVICKHESAIRAVIEEGGIPPRLPAEKQGGTTVATGPEKLESSSR